MEKQKNVAQGTGSEPGIPPDFLCGSENVLSALLLLLMFWWGAEEGGSCCVWLFLFCFVLVTKWGAKNITCKALCQS